MDRCVVLVDAGYLYAEGGRLCCGTRARAHIELDAAVATAVLTGLARSITGLPVLRTYWYDGAKDGIRTHEQTAIAALDDVKVRLGRLNGRGQQKGVDALIYRDLITLAQQRSISDAVLVSGDEDLREGVRAAQDLGVRVVLVGVDSTPHRNQSEELQLEADRVVLLARDRLEPMFSLRRPVVMSSVSVTGPTGRSVAPIAVQFARSWLARATEAEIADLWAARPRIPRPLDIELIFEIESKIRN